MKAQTNMISTELWCAGSLFFVPKFCLHVKIYIRSCYTLEIIAYRDSDQHMGESSNFQNPEFSKLPILKLAVCPLNIHNFKFKWSIVFRKTENKSEKLL